MEEKKEACNCDVECLGTMTCPHTCQCSRCNKGTSSSSSISDHAAQQKHTATAAVPSKYAATGSQPETSVIIETGKDAKDSTGNVHQAKQSADGQLLSETSQSTHRMQRSFNISTESSTEPKVDASLSPSAEKNSSVGMPVVLRTRSSPHKEQPQGVIFRINPHAATAVSIGRRYNLRPRDTSLKKVKRTDHQEGPSRLKSSTKILKNSCARNPHQENLPPKTDPPLANALQKYSSTEEASHLCQMEISDRGLNEPEFRDETFHQMKKLCQMGRSPRRFHNHSKSHSFILNLPKTEMLQSYPAPLREKNSSAGVPMELRTRSSPHKEQPQGVIFRINPHAATAVSIGRSYNLRPRDTSLKKVKHTDSHEGAPLAKSLAKSPHSSSNKTTRDINKVSPQISPCVSSTGSHEKHSSLEETYYHPSEITGSPKKSSSRKIPERSQGIHISSIKCSEDSILLQENESIEKSVREPTTSVEGKSTSDVRITEESFLAVLSKECPVSSLSISLETTKSNYEKSEFIIHSVSSNVNLSDNPITPESTSNLTNRSKTYSSTITVNDSVAIGQLYIISSCTSSCSTRETPSSYSTRGIPLSYSPQRIDSSNSRQNSGGTCFVMTDSPSITEGHLLHSPRQSLPNYVPRGLPLKDFPPGAPVSDVPQSMPPSNLLPSETPLLLPRIFAPLISPQGTPPSYSPFQYSGQNSKETFSANPVLPSSVKNQTPYLLNVSSIAGCGGVSYQPTDPSIPYIFKTPQSLGIQGDPSALVHPRELDFFYTSGNPIPINASEELMNFPLEQNPSLYPALFETSGCSSSLPSFILQSEDTALKINSSGSSISQQKLSSFATPIVLESATSPQDNLVSLNSFHKGEDRYNEQLKEDDSSVISEEDDDSFISDEDVSIILSNVDMSSFLSSDDVSRYLSSDVFDSREGEDDC